MKKMEYGDSTLLNTLLSMILHLSGCVRTWPFPIFHKKLWVLANQGINWGRQRLPRREFRCLASVLSLQHCAVEGVGTQQLSESKTSCIPKWNSHVQNHIKFTFGKKIKPNQAFIKSYKREISRYPQACRPYFNIWRPGGKWKIGQNAERISRGR